MNKINLTAFVVMMVFVTTLIELLFYKTLPIMKNVVKELLAIVKDSYRVVIESFKKDDNEELTSFVEDAVQFSLEYESQHEEREKVDLTVPSLWMGSDEQLKILYPNGRVEFFNEHNFENDRWTESIFSRKTVEEAYEDLNRYADFISNIK